MVGWTLQVKGHTGQLVYHQCKQSVLNDQLCGIHNRFSTLCKCILQNDFPNVSFCIKPIQTREQFKSENIKTQKKIFLVKINELK